MADILKDVVTGEICLNDFIEWLKYDKSDIEKLRLVGNSEFIPFFLNYVKDKCSQVLKSGKDDSISIQNIVNNRFPDTTSKVNKDHAKENVNYQFSKFRELGVGARNNEQIYNTDGIKTKSTAVYQNGYSQPKSMAVHQNGYSQGKSTIIHQNGYSQGKSTTIHQNGYSHVKSVTSYHDPFHQSKNFQKVPQNLNLGCAPYLHKQKDFKSSFYKTKANPEIPDINSVEAFPPVSGKADQTRARRRITPTPIQVSDNSSLRFGHSCFTVPMEKVQSNVFKMMPLQEQSYSTLQEERDMLKYTRSVMSKPLGVSSNIAVEKSVKKSVMQPVSIEYIIPNPQKIYFQEQILIIAEIYGFLVSNALVSNITSELYFLFELITARVSTESKPSEDDILSSVHNCVYFAVSVLTKHCYLLQVLDNATLSSLCEIPYLFTFSPQLVHFLQLYLDVGKFSHSLAKQEAVSSLNSINSVAFQAEEDSRSNFINDNTFVSFRKQRDLFYELLQEWQQKSMEYVDSNFYEKFSRKAKLLVNLGPNTVNLYHLAKLFHSQLIASCLYLEVSEVKDELLRDIQRNFPGKFEKLQERFLMPFCSGGLNPSPTFYGIQSFFYELLNAAGSACLNQHLTNILVSNLLDLNNVDISLDSDVTSLLTIKEKYRLLMHTMRLLGKFLGYLHFSPYKVTDALPSNVMYSQLATRKYHKPPLDVAELLIESVKSNKIILTVPWVIEFLSMMDPIALNIEHYIKALQILTDIYRWEHFKALPTESILFIRLVIGWLFDVLEYPKKYEVLIKPESFEYLKNLESCGIDFLAVVDKQLIRSCCPYLIEFRVLIYNFLNGIKNRNREIRKITPLSTKIEKTNSASVVKKQLNMQLEDNFFSYHPPSVKKTTEFVADRMASKTIGKIRSEVTDLKLTVVKNIMSDKQFSSMYASNALNKIQIDAVIDDNVLNVYNEFQNKLQDFIKAIHKNIENTLPLLLSDDTKPVVLDMCSKVAYRLAADKTADWIDSNLLLDPIKSDIKNKLFHLKKGEVESKADKSIDLSYWIQFLRKTILDVHSKSDSLTVDVLTSVTLKIAALITDQKVNTILKKILLLTVDLYIAVVVHAPVLCCSSVLQNFVSLWLKLPENVLCEKLFLCPKNIKFLLTSKSLEISWAAYLHIFDDLLKRNIFNVQQLQLCLKCVNELQWEDKHMEKLLSEFNDTLTKYPQS